MTVDPITLEVFRNRFDSIAQEMQTSLLRSGYSIILKEGADASCALFSPNGEVISQAASHPIHLAALIPAVTRIIERFGVSQMAPGDVFLLNDPYDGGTHLPDVIVVVPIHFKDSVIALGCSLAHQQDFGGKAPGSMVTDATEIFQEGLILPPLRFYDRGVLNETLTQIISRNVRIPEEVFGDLAAQVAAGKTGARRVVELINQYSLSTFTEAIAQLLDHAEALTRTEIAKIPDGDYSFTDYLDNDGIDLDTRIPIAVTIRVHGSNVTVDLAGTSAQVRGPANSAPTGALAPIYYVMRAICGSDIPNNSGCFRPITVQIPEGSLFNPRHPAPVSIRSHTLKRLVDAMFGALAPALPDRIPAASHGGLMCVSLGGIRAITHKQFVYMECNAGGTGATLAADGVDNLDTNTNNARNIPAEAAELEFPVRISENRLRVDSGGAGRTRGGLGTIRVIELLDGEVTVNHRNDRHFTRPWGLFGGMAGASWKTTIVRANGEQFEVPARQAFVMAAGDRMIGEMGGGGGYGDPLERTPDQVLADVLDGKVSKAVALDLYRVAIEGRAVDVRRTHQIRQRALESRPPDTEARIFDRGLSSVE